MLPFVGHHTFLRSRVVSDRKNIVADISFVGVPFDSGSSNRPGSRYGPQHIREASMLYSYSNTPDKFKGLYDVDEDKYLLSDIDIIDTGDIEVLPTNLHATREHITEEIRKIYNANSFPVSVGGDHSISYGCISPIQEPITVIHFDAHCDFMDLSSDDYCAHGNVMRKVSELQNIEKIIHIGIRGLFNSEDGVKESKKRGNIILKANDVLTTGTDILTDYLSPLKKYYISFDIDVLDPVFAPGTGTPEPGGLSYLLARDLLRKIALNHHVKGIDLVEINPLYDPMKITGIYAMRLLIDFLGANFSKDKNS